MMNARILWNWNKRLQWVMLAFDLWMVWLAAKGDNYAGMTFFLGCAAVNLIFAELCARMVDRLGGRTE